ncbi:YkgJ family cysteine cluster protein [Desulforamulus ferrireducens]|uniref:Zinc/iron-chelating domain-containing protein n=1 Tax=Desulforamulus ferrireducens TaxID=1833852 RepID=A0A1S6IXS3_9FIRM|nr:YkgJ family cysteine cluster protein [Desulforamulus ferrireducens]AQS59540.1 zinc/iron-chelating domain-containing protein [Desulforamulus ferrireducens]
MKLRVFQKPDKSYDIEVLDPQATIQDYLDAINYFIETTMEPPCRGCDECCWERIPLTSIDALTYVEKLAEQLDLEKNWPLLSFLKDYCYIYVEGPVVDISLGYTLEGACGFLNQEERICSNYMARSLVCQSFVCLESSEQAQELRSQLVNAGMDELVRLWLIQSQQAGQKPFMHEQHQAAPCLEDYPVNAFTGKVGYGQVLLKDVCTPELWGQIFRASDQ